MAHAFLWQDGAMRDLGTLLQSDSLSWGFGINSFGVVVGLSEGGPDTNYLDHAFVRYAGKMRDLNGLIPKQAGWVLNIAYGINDSGQIVGEGTIGGKIHAFLLTPN